MRKPIYVPMKLLRWSAIELATGGHAVPSQNDKSIGFLQVYDSLDLLRAAYGDDTHVQELSIEVKEQS